MTDPTPVETAPVVAPTPTAVTASSVVADVEDKAEGIWAKIGQHPVAVVFVLAVAGFGALHFLGIF